MMLKATDKMVTKSLLLRPYNIQLISCSKISFQRTSEGFPIEYPSKKRFNEKDTSLSVKTATMKMNREIQDLGNTKITNRIYSFFFLFCF